MKNLIITITIMISVAFSEENCQISIHDYSDVGMYFKFKICYTEVFDERLYDNLVDTSTVLVETQEDMLQNSEYWSVCPRGKYRDKRNIKLRIKLYRSNGTLRFNGNTWMTGCQKQRKGKIDLSTLVFYEGYCVTKSGNTGDFVNDPSECK